MRALVVGKGGREHAIAWSLSKSPLVDELLCAPGNPGMAALGECVDVASDDIAGIAKLAKERRVGLAVIGPEAPLVAGVSDALDEQGIAVFGPGAAGARLEGSKSYAKSLMGKYEVPTARAAGFDRAEEATAYAKKVGPPLVVKADGLAEGKGVTVCSTLDEANAAIRDAMEARRFGEAGSRILIEERLEGRELSILAFCDGKTILPMHEARDYKRIFDEDRGPNTGGMGSYSPVPDASPVLLDRVDGEILEPIAAGLEKEGVSYKGVIYAGLMLTAEGPKVIEFNCRFGDPEAQALLPRLSSDLVEPMLASIEGSLAGVKLSWRPDACVCVVAASGGYPGEYQTGFAISGLDKAEAISGIPAFHAGTAIRDGELVTAGGRILGLSALGVDHTAAREKAYRALSQVSFEGIHYRRDIALGEPNHRQPEGVGGVRS